MSRGGLVAMHLLAVPAAVLAAVLIFLALVLVLPHGVFPLVIDIPVHDAYLVVPQLYVSTLLGGFVIVTTLVAYRYGRLNWALGAAWILLFLHLTAALMPWGRGLASEASLTVRAIRLQASVALAFVGSAVAGLLASVLGLLVSLVKALQQAPRTEA